jgi:acyl-CoA reductase-like NAD-dependent aldehyde dehydrogenase
LTNRPDHIIMSAKLLFLIRAGGLSEQVMKEESFGPILPVMAVQSDEEAVRLMNDSDYGLTAAVFSASTERVEQMGSELQFGTIFANRCDALDPELPWGGVKDTGKGVSLSAYGFQSFTKLKGYHLKHADA